MNTFLWNFILYSIFDYYYIHCTMLNNTKYYWELFFLCNKRFSLSLNNIQYIHEVKIFISFFLKKVFVIHKKQYWVCEQTWKIINFNSAVIKKIYSDNGQLWFFISIFIWRKMLLWALNSSTLALCVFNSLWELTYWEKSGFDFMLYL